MFDPNWPGLDPNFKATEDKTQNQENKNQENQAVENQNNQSATSFLTYFMILLFAMLAGMSWILNFLNSNKFYGLRKDYFYIYFECVWNSKSPKIQQKILNGESWISSIQKP